MNTRNTTTQDPISQNILAYLSVCIYQMSLFQFILIVAAVVFLLFGIDLYKRKRVTILHLLVFVGGSIAIIWFTYVPSWLDSFGEFFGLARGADLIVYISIIVIFYLYIGLYNNNIKQKFEQTRLVRQIAINNAQWSLGNAKIAVVIPAWNEPDEAVHIIQNVLDHWHGVVFIDDGSSNDLYAKIQANITSDKLVLLQHVINMWQGAALQTWFDFITKYIQKNTHQLEYIATYDSDGQQDIKEINNFLNAYEKNPKLEIVLGSRFIQSNQEKIPFFRKIILKWWVLFTGAVSGLWLTDSQNGYRVMKLNTLKKIRISMNGMAHASEILDQIKDNKLVFQEVPVTVTYEWIRPSLVQSNGNAIKIAIKILYKKLFFR